MRHLATLVTMLLIEKRPHSDSYAPEYGFGR